MTRLLLPTLLALAFAPAQDLSTHYSTEKALRTEVTSSFHMETIAFSMLIDGEPREGGFGGGATTDETRAITMVDTVVEADDGVPTHVRREFETLTSNMTMMMREEERDMERECPLNGVVLSIVDDGGDITTEVVEGSEPDDEKVLDGHQPGLALDALLPEEEVAAGDSWAIEGEDLARALGFDLEHALFPRPEPEEREGGGEGRGRGGRRGGSRGGAQSAGRFFALGDWEVEATLGSEPEEYNGQMCHVIAIEGEASGEIPEQERGGGRDRDRQDGAVSFAAASTILRPESSFESELEGTLYISVEGRHPVHFEFEAEFGIESLRVMERRGSEYEISSVQEGKLKYTVDITSVAADSDE